MKKPLTTALVLGALGVAASPAGATTVGYGTGKDERVLFVDGTDGDNTVHLSYSGSRIVVRDISGLTPRTGCRRAAGDRDKALCRLAPGLGRRAVVRLNGGKDTALVYQGARAKLAVEVWGGNGNDALAAQAGPRVAYLLGQNDDDTIHGSASNEALWGGPGHDTIVPGAGVDHIDGGHGDFARSGRPVFRVWDASREQAPGPGSTTDHSYTYCASRTGGFADRLRDRDEDNRGTSNWTGAYYTTGVDTLWLRPSPGGALADLDVCRLGFFGTDDVSLVHGIENVHGTPLNDRLTADGDRNSLYPRAGQDWVGGNLSGDRIDTRDGEVDTVCNTVPAQPADWQYDGQPGAHGAPPPEGTPRDRGVSC